jgi:hypothetical protein
MQGAWGRAIGRPFHEGMKFGVWTAESSTANEQPEACPRQSLGGIPLQELVLCFPKNMDSEH